MITPKKENKKQILLAVPKGMRDILPAEYPYWKKAREAFSEIAEYYSFGQIETPILEHADIFIRGIGNETDIVEKEMYTLKTKGGDSLALRPEHTAPVMRSFVENGMSRQPQPVKLWYFGPVFRHDNPQAGRYRQVHQAGFEVIGGEAEPAYDAQVILSGVRFLQEMRIKDPLIRINSIGCRSCRVNYKKKLLEYYRKEGIVRKKAGVKGNICKDCDRRMDNNILRLLDCKNEICVEIRSKAPSILDNLCSPCRTYLKRVLEFLGEANIPYTLDSHLVRGLDYYARTVFEFYAENGGLAIGGGGRYDYLGEMLGGRITPAVGCSLGLDRIIDHLKAKEISFEPRKKDKIFIAHVGEVAKAKVFALIEEFREANVRAIEALGKDGLQAQMKVADREEVALTLILGQKEVYEKSIIIRNMKTGAQENVPISKVVEEVKKRLKKD